MVPSIGGPMHPREREVEGGCHDARKRVHILTAPHRTRTASTPKAIHGWLPTEPSRRPRSHGTDHRPWHGSSRGEIDGRMPRRHGQAHHLKLHSVGRPAFAQLLLLPTLTRSIHSNARGHFYVSAAIASSMAASPHPSTLDETKTTCFITKDFPVSRQKN